MQQLFKINPAMPVNSEDFFSIKSIILRSTKVSGILKKPHTKEHEFTHVTKEL